MKGLRSGFESTTSNFKHVEYANRHVTQETSFMDEGDEDAKEVIDLVWDIYGKYTSIHSPTSPTNQAVPGALLRTVATT